VHAGSVPSTIDEALASAGVNRAVVKTLRTQPRPALGRLRQVKDALCARLDAATAANEFLQLVGNAPGAAPRLPFANLIDHARAHAVRFEVISPAHAVAMPPVPVFGDPAREGFDARTRCVFACVLDDAVVSSRSNVIVAGQHALLDVQDGERDLIPLDLGVDPVVFAPDGTHATIAIEQHGVDGPVLDEAFTLLGLNSYNYWHWHIEFLPRLLACLDLPGFAGVPILVDAQMPAQNLVALRFMVGERHPLHVVPAGEAVRVRRLWTAAMFTYIPLWPMPGVAYATRTMVIDAPAFAAQVQRLEPALAPLRTGTGARRLYLARKPSQHRGMDNAAQVEAWFVAHGFRSVDFAEFAFEEQLRLVRDADVIVGPNGAALVNGLFAGAGTAIGILDNSFVEDNEWYAAVCASLGQRLSFLVGEVLAADPVYEYNANYRIDLDALPGWLEHLLA
jgi:capsular polysaccharide biosynthesis protein